MEQEKPSNSYTKPTNELEKKGANKKKLIIEFAIYIVLIFVCAYVVPKYVLQKTLIEGDSMESNFSNGDHVLVEKLSVKMNQLDRFDVIVFYPYGRESEEYYVKRIIGLPGETVQIKDSIIYINGEVLEEDYGKDPTRDAGIASTPITLKDDEYFVLGDNREISLDSRSEQVGLLKRENIEGRVILRIWPLSKFGSVK